VETVEEAIADWEVARFIFLIGALTDTLIQTGKITAAETEVWLAARERTRRPSTSAYDSVGASWWARSCP